jgi:hypothetical protein
MTEPRLPRCSRCGRERSATEVRSRASDLCTTCRGYDRAASNTFGLLREEVFAVEGGWRAARTLDSSFSGWLCPHVHETREDAENCRVDREPLLGPS